MSLENTAKSDGKLRINGTGKKIQGSLVAGEKGAEFFARNQQEPIVQWQYDQMADLSSVRISETALKVTVVLQDGTKYEFELRQGHSVYSHMDKHWSNKPVRTYTRADELRRLAEMRGERIQQPRHHLIKRRHPNRSIAGDLGIYLMLVIVGFLMVFPLVFMVGSSLKPLDELFRFPPPIWPQNPTMDNFSDLMVTMRQSWVPFSRYLTNTVFITAVGTFGHLVIASMAAFVLAKYDFPGSRVFFGVVTTCLMFSGYVTGIPNYLILSKLGMVDTYWALILPAFAAPIGLFLMKQVMEGLPTALIEAASLDGAGLFRIFWTIVMPNVKPAWLTMMIFSIQGLWNTSASTVIYSEAKKTLVYALQQIRAGGIAREGQVAAANVVIIAVPILIFIFNQSQILETMASSGIKD